MTKSTFIAVLNLDQQNPDLLAYGDYGDMGILLMRKAGIVDQELRKYNVIDNMEFPSQDSLQNVAAIYITGSKYDSWRYSEYEWMQKLIAFIQDVYFNHKIPLIGICFGHQIIAIALGGTAKKVGWEIGTEKVQVSLTDGHIQTLTGNSKKVAKDLAEKGSFLVSEYHQDAVTKIPVETINYGSTSNQQIQGLINDRIFTFQGHPEFPTEVEYSLLEKRIDIVGKELYEDALKRKDEDDGFFLGRLIKSFIGI
ncbi:Putative glutamine amidotransferase [Komagataella phaffii CBS 7435]|uniref:Glutamine amidotransferase domain-containing protein n=2 Tax=Komagataella phaffii TaxID=460519 RepID=C4QZF8_KOMPG|nr:uncharacterized protein PAS_chr2-1_0032 [Komagataella phaffii GS115]AOA62415.1 GQ67_00057T0 [Komagataella phaffii]CAH2448872.1 Putative glutamine amidotransferase [Komagataella phaffii CBS 7435]AOA68077.1 GQ68_01330T0 [Komagataella phaffii GS115]CAY68632.1 Putative protein of unknown function with similarity to glutamine amidotransferase proteins [Komagataella phaffii GS115]CCA38949.1 Putative glutamine amidotransferase [Komagataella phaffii CBS 7435]